MRNATGQRSTLALILHAFGLLTGRSIGTLATFAYTIVITRSMPREEVGVMMSIMSAAFIASVLVSLNIESNSIRVLPRNDTPAERSAASGLIRFSRRVLLVGSPIVMIAFVGLAWLVDGSATPAALGAYAAAAASIPLMAWLRVGARHGTAAAKVTQGTLPRSTLQPLLYLGILCAVVAAGAHLTPTLALGLFFFSFATTALVQYRLLRRTLAPIEAHPPAFTDRGEWVRSGLLLSTSLIVLEYLQHLITATAALGLPAEDVAKLSIALRVVTLVRYGQVAVLMSFSPQIARAIQRDDPARRDQLLATLGHLRWWPTAAFALLVVVFPSLLPGLFGPEYRAAGDALRWLLLIPLSTAIFGPNQLLMNITGRSGTIFVRSTAMIVLLAVAVPLCGHQWGLEGAAAAAGICVLLGELALFTAVRLGTGVDASLIATFASTLRRFMRSPA